MTQLDYRQVVDEASELMDTAINMGLSEAIVEVMKRKVALTLREELA